jgi:cellulose synthase/poly-beta-1,6-N-acetylglucosamine synthase-like glycosyltransferase
MMNAAGAGEGVYWRYESALKKLDSRLHSVVGAAGELFSVRTALFEPVPEDTLIEDFVVTMRIAAKGYWIAYEPRAYAVEGQSTSTREELKRKIRIAAGGLQAIRRLGPLLNIFRFGVLSFQYISHRVLRWTIAPLSLPLVLFLNAILAAKGGGVYPVLFVLQLIFYLIAWIGFLWRDRRVKIKLLYIPYYFCMMNYAVYLGFIRWVTNTQSVVWEKAERSVFEA